MKYILIIFTVCLTLLVHAEDIKCLNGGIIKPKNCLCPKGFIGKNCQIKAKQFQHFKILSTLQQKYSYFYFQPKQINYYRLTFNVCMIANPSRAATMFYFETEKEDGSFRQIPHVFSSAKIVLGETGCTVFSTSYIGSKRKEDQLYRRIIFGFKIMGANETDQYTNVYQAIDAVQLKNIQNPLDQDISIQMNYQTYIQTTYYANFIVLFTALFLVLIFLIFVTYIKRKFSTPDLMEMRQVNRATLEALQLLQLQYIRNRTNPQRIYQSINRTQTLENIQVFMPVTKYGIYGFINQINQNSQMDEMTCSICLLQFEKGDQVRITPCRHTYHKDCIDSWCQSHVNYLNPPTCPICRYQLDFTPQIRKIWLQLYRSGLAN